MSVLNVTNVYATQLLEGVKKDDLAFGRLLSKRYRCIRDQFVKNHENRKQYFMSKNINYIMFLFCNQQRQKEVKNLTINKKNCYKLKKASLTIR